MTEPPAALPGKQIRLVTRTKERYREVQQLLADGASRAEVGRRLGLDIQTVRRFADATGIEQLLANTRRDSLIDPHKAHLHQRWNDGCTDTAVLHAEIREQGFRGSVQTLRRYLRPFRPIEDGTRRHLRAPSTPPAPKPRRVAKWIMSDPAKIRPEDQQKLDAIRRRSPALDTLASYVQDFADMMHKLRGDRLPQWIAAVLAGDVTELHSFAKGLQRDLAAATAGLTLPWSLRASRAPGRPARATAIAVNATRNGGLYRAYGLVKPGICSTNVVRAHPGWQQTSRRTSSRITTARPASAVSANCR